MPVLVFENALTDECKAVLLLVVALSLALLVLKSFSREE